MQKTGLTYEQLYNKCKKFKIGDKVKVKKQIRLDRNNCKSVYIAGTVQERYQNHLVVSISEFRQESFTYADIIMFEKVKKKRERKNSEKAKVILSKIS